MSKNEKSINENSIRVLSNLVLGIGIFSLLIFLTTPFSLIPGTLGLIIGIYVLNNYKNLPNKRIHFGVIFNSLAIILPLLFVILAHIFSW